ncbi:MAG: GNAT family N-acetyltransferase [Acidobacteriota bacterium]
MATDDAQRDAALRLFGAVWPHLPGGIESARRLGSDWFEVSTPFTAYDGERLVAHAGVITCQLAVAGEPYNVAAIHGVCVHPEYRGQGLARRVLEEALRFIENAGLETTILWSEKVDLYRRFSFVPTPEHVFAAPAPAASPCPAFGLDLGMEPHRELLRLRLRQRRPVSNTIAAADDGWHFLIDLGLWPEAQDYLFALPEQQAIMVCQLEHGKLRLFDVVAAEPPPARLLVGAAEQLFGSEVEHLEVYFSPDRIELDAEPRSHPIEDVLMVRGLNLLPTTAGPFGLSPFTRT